MQPDDANHTLDASASELARVRQALGTLGTDDLPSDVAERLTTLLQAQPPLVGRRRRHRSRFALAGLAPALVAGVVAVVILASSPTTPRQHPPAAKHPSAAAAQVSVLDQARVQAPTASTPATPQATGAAQASSQALTRVHSDAVTSAARAAYEAAEAAIHARRRKP